MKIYLCLALGALVLLTSDANEDDRLPALCILKRRKCNAELPRGWHGMVNEKNELGVDCSTLEGDRKCLGSLLNPDSAFSCAYMGHEEITRNKVMFFRIKKYLCDNENAFVSGKACWRSPAFGPSIRDCDICEVRSCLQGYFGTVAECSDTEADLLSGIANQTMAYEDSCTAQSDRLSYEDLY